MATAVALGCTGAIEAEEAGAVQPPSAVAGESGEGGGAVDADAEAASWDVGGA